MSRKKTNPILIPATLLALCLAAMGAAGAARAESPAPFAAGEGRHYCSGFEAKPFLKESLIPAGSPAIESYRGRVPRSGPVADPQGRSRDLARAMVEGGGEKSVFEKASAALAKGPSAPAAESCGEAKAAAYAFKFSDGGARRLQVRKSPSEQIHMPPAAARVELWCKPGALGAAPDAVRVLAPSAMAPKLDASRACGGYPAARMDVVYVHADGGWFVDSTTGAAHEAAVGGIVDAAPDGWLRPADAGDGVKVVLVQLK